MRTHTLAIFTLTALLAGCQGMTATERAAFDALTVRVEKCEEKILVGQSKIDWLCDMAEIGKSADFDHQAQLNKHKRLIDWLVHMTPPGGGPSPAGVETAYSARVAGAPAPAPSPALALGAHGAGTQDAGRAYVPLQVDATTDTRVVAWNLYCRDALDGPRALLKSGAYATLSEAGGVLTGLTASLPVGASRWLSLTWLTAHLESGESNLLDVTEDIRPLANPTSLGRNAALDKARP